ncbi:hypothetical protein AAVH_36481 [Aphelenchoides avenae]|nr:hypothetical protein AAVH_36481 [Aphelenchus avenae]
MTMVRPHVVPIVIATIPFFILQVCMIAFVCCKRRKDDVYRTGFFAVYVAVSIADCALMILIVSFGLVAFLGFFSDLYMHCSACSGILLKSAEYLQCFQLFCHAAIAVNRFTCFGKDSIHNCLWRGRGLMLVMFILLISPLVLTAYQLPFSTHYIILNGSVLAGARRDDDAMNKVIQTFDCFLYASVTFIEFVLSIAAIKRIRMFKANQLPAQLQIQTKLLGKRRGIVVFTGRTSAYSIYMVFVQLLRAVYFPASVLGQEVPWLGYVALTFHPLLELYCFSGTVFLLLARCRQTRKDFLSFYCIVSNERCFKTRSGSNQHSPENAGIVN